MYLTCVNCGRSSEEWSGSNGHGFTYDGETFCCRRCALEAACSCIDRWNANTDYRAETNIDTALNTHEEMVNPDRTGQLEPEMPAPEEEFHMHRLPRPNAR